MKRPSISPVASRETLVERECQGDEELRNEVERLLGAREHLPEWLAGPVLGMAHATAFEAYSTVTQSVPSGHVPFAPGSVLGQRYRIVHILGRGPAGRQRGSDRIQSACLHGEGWLRARCRQAGPNHCRRLFASIGIAIEWRDLYPRCEAAQDQPILVYLSMHTD
jgi:hypothetical protein